MSLNQLIPGSPRLSVHNNWLDVVLNFRCDIIDNVPRGLRLSGVGFLPCFQWSAPQLFSHASIACPAVAPCVTWLPTQLGVWHLGIPFHLKECISSFLAKTLMATRPITDIAFRFTIPLLYTQTYVVHEKVRLAMFNFAELVCRRVLWGCVLHGTVSGKLLC